MRKEEEERVREGCVREGASRWRKEGVQKGGKGGEGEKGREGKREEEVERMREEGEGEKESMEIVVCTRKKESGLESELECSFAFSPFEFEYFE